jgi:hypothetical protein
MLFLNSIGKKRSFKTDGAAIEKLAEKIIASDEKVSASQKS